MNCELCGKRPRAIYLTHSQINKYVCWTCLQWAVTAVHDKQPIYRYVTRKIEVESQMSKIRSKAKEIARWLLAL